VSSASEVILRTQGFISYNSNPAWKGGKVLAQYRNRKFRCFYFHCTI